MAVDHVRQRLYVGDLRIAFMRQCHFGRRGQDEVRLDIQIAEYLQTPDAVYNA